jgi:hypothetical protein
MASNTIDGIFSLPLYDPCQALGQFFQYVCEQSKLPIIPGNPWTSLCSSIMLLKSVEVGSRNHLLV